MNLCMSYLIRVLLVRRFNNVTYAVFELLTDTKRFPQAQPDGESPGVH